MTYDPEVHWVLMRGAHMRLQLYVSETAAMRALGKPNENSEGSEIERQRRDGWRVVRVRVKPDVCSLCGEPKDSEHECRREEP